MIFQQRFVMVPQYLGLILRGRRKKKNSALPLRFRCLAARGGRRRTRPRMPRGVYAAARRAAAGGGSAPARRRACVCTARRCVPRCLPGCGSLPGAFAHHACAPPPRYIPLRAVRPAAANKLAAAPDAHFAYLPRVSPRRARATATHAAPTLRAAHLHYATHLHYRAARTWLARWFAFYGAAV